MKGQLSGRGWTEQEVRDLAKAEPTGKSTDNRGGRKTPDGQKRNDTATVYGLKADHIIVNDRTREVTQISDKLDPKWNPDNCIKWH